MGVQVHTSTRVSNYDGNQVVLNSHNIIDSKTLIWAAGIKGNFLGGIPDFALGRGNRILVDEFNRVRSFSNVYAIGDVALMKTTKYPNGHPQLAQVAIQQGKRLAKNFKRGQNGKLQEEFLYKDLGSMATIGRNKAVVELPRFKFYGFFAWVVWMTIHLRSILGIKNKFLIFMNWVWSYFTYNLSRRLIRDKKPELDSGVIEKQSIISQV